MIEICKNCGERVTRVSAILEDPRVRHSLTYSYECNLPKDSNGYSRNSVLMVVKDKEEWFDYRHVIQTGRVPLPIPKSAWEEHSYMLFARANVKEGIAVPPDIVKALLARIDRLEMEKMRGH